MMVIYRFTTYDKGGSQLRIYTLSARKAEDLLETYAHNHNYYGSHVFGQTVNEKYIEDLQERDEHFI